MYKLIIISYIPDLVFWTICTIWRNKQKRDIEWLKKKYIKNYNGWNIGHFISYFIKGAYFKTKYILEFFLIGFIFELIEYLIQHKTSINFVRSSIIRDTIINMSGYISGIIFIVIVRSLILNQVYQNAISNQNAETTK